MKKLSFLILFLLTLSISAKAYATDIYSNYSLMNGSNAGQIWSSVGASSQWAWSPQSSTESYIQWGNPANWPPSYYEDFYHDNDWVYLKGSNNEDLRVTDEQIGDVNCNNLVSIPLNNPAYQHYTKWGISPSTDYCLKANGTLTDTTTGSVVNFGHEQIWYHPQSCSNAYYSNKTCLIQFESWWDNNGHPFQEVIRRRVWIAKNIGMAFKIQNYVANSQPDTSVLNLRYFWSY